MTAVVTSFGPAGWDSYAKRFLDSFDQHWPVHIELLAYREAAEEHPRAQMRNLLDLPECAAFLKRHAGMEAPAGRAPMPCWKSADIERGYGYRTDAVKFCRKVFALADAARYAIDVGHEILAWIDADVVTRQNVPRRLIETTLGPIAEVAFLGRPRTHSECGFMAFRLPNALPLIEALERMYAQDYVFDLPEWHDSFVFDYVRAQMPDLIQRDLTPGGSGHVWIRSPLWPWLDHLKGDRKQLGYSPEGLHEARRPVLGT